MHHLSGSLKVLGLLDHLLLMHMSRVRDAISETLHATSVWANARTAPLGIGLPVGQLRVELEQLERVVTCALERVSNAERGVGPNVEIIGLRSYVSHLTLLGAAVGRFWEAVIMATK